MTSDWDPTAEDAGRSPDGFSDAADALLKTYTKRYIPPDNDDAQPYSISNYLNGGLEEDDVNEGTSCTTIVIAYNHGPRLSSCFVSFSFGSR